MAEVNRNGLLGTVVFHGLILFLLLFFGFSYPDPPPEEEGILVNFGTSDTGYGYIEPAGDPTQGGDSQAEEAVKETVQESSVPVSRPVVEEVVEDVQDYEETPVKENKPTPEEIRQKEIEKQKAIEREKLRQEELERQRIEAEKKRIEEEKRKQAEKLQKMGEDAFGNKGVGTESGSQGVTEGDGNQGVIGGQPGAENYGEGSGLGNGITHGFGNRKGRGTAPKPNVGNCEVTSRIIVRVQMDLDSDGNVIGNPKILDATYQDECIYTAVLTAAKATKFEASAEFRQRGWVRYIIDPQ